MVDTERGGWWSPSPTSQLTPGSGRAPCRGCSTTARASATRTRARVLAAIELLDYRPNPLARGLSRGRCQTLGVVVPFFTHASAVERLRGVAAALDGSRYDLVLFNVESPVHRDEHFATLTRRDRADGLLIMSLPPPPHSLARLADAGVPVVLLDTSGRGVPAVVTDDVEGGRLATRHLLALGHERIAFIGDDPDNPLGFTAGSSREAGLPPDDGRRRRGRSRPATCATVPMSVPSPAGSPSGCWRGATGRRRCSPRPTSRRSACSRRPGPQASTCPGTCRWWASTTSRSPATRGSPPCASPCSRAARWQLAYFSTPWRRGTFPSPVSTASGSSWWSGRPPRRRLGDGTAAHRQHQETMPAR